MTLPNGFLFTDVNLQDYIECQRRFQLRYIERLAWPAVEVEPYREYERLVDRDKQFHKIVRQHLAGIPESQILTSIEKDEDLKLFWNNYLQSYKSGFLSQVFKDSTKYFTELTVSIPLGDHRLAARYDALILCQDGKLVIIEWQTAQKRPSRDWLAERMKTHIYPFILSQSLAGIVPQDKVDPSKIELIYWFCNAPEQPERFGYNQQAFLDDEHWLTNMISSIDQKTEPIFPLTPDLRRCLFCVYRSYCDRGVTPGTLDELEEWQVLNYKSGSIGFENGLIDGIES